MTEYRNVRLNLDTYHRLRADADAHGRPLGAHVGELLDRPAAVRAGDLGDRLDRLEAGLDRIAAALQVLQVAIVNQPTPPRAERPAARQPVAVPAAVRAPAGAGEGADKGKMRKGRRGAAQAVLNAARAEGLPATARELVAWREGLGLHTQGDLADRLDCSRQAVSNQESASARGGDLDSEIGTRFLRRLLAARERGAV